jgi:uncharacterized membrane protein YvbJ
MKCPKCGYMSTNEQVCDSCGVSLSKLRSRQFEEETAADAGRQTVWEQPQGVNLTRNLMIVFVALIVVGLAFYQVHRRNQAEKEAAASAAELAIP